MSEFRKWEDLELDCLVNVLGRLGMESLLLNVPFVCKSWHKASHNSQCWLHIDFPYIPLSGLSQFVRRFIDTYQVKNFSVHGLVNLVFSRGPARSASLFLLNEYSEKDLQHVVAKCPELKSLSLNWRKQPKSFVVPKLIGELKQLEELRIESYTTIEIFGGIMTEIGCNCNNFHSLTISHGHFKKEFVLAISRCLPKIKNLSIKRCCIEQENLEIILSGCKDLEHLVVSEPEYRGIWEKNRLKQLASHIKTFNLDAPC